MPLWCVVNWFLKVTNLGKILTGLNLPLKNIMGRKTLPPNEIVVQYDEERGS